VSIEAWELAHRAAAAAGVELGPLTSVEDADAIIRVLVATWGQEQVVPRETLRALAESGNVPYGAFDGRELVGYVLGWAGVDPVEGLHVHSHMLAALPHRRHRGVGYALKLAQRAQALEQGIRTVRWTFDPLVARNAYFNLRKLGAVADRFERAFYGEMTDAVNRGDRSDRLVVRWDVDRPPGSTGGGEAGDAMAVIAEGPVFAGVPEGGRRPVFLRIPEDYPTMRRKDAALAGRWRDVVADALEGCLAAGLVAAGFARGEGASGYVLTPSGDA
jgi:predicted GNAT superfamily acetyltransferase